MEDKKVFFLHAVFITFISIAIVIVAVFYVRDWENQRLIKSFNFSANTYHQLLEGRLREIILELESTKRFFQGSNFVDRDEFSSFVAETVSKSKEITAISWVPLITDRQRSSIEQESWDRGFNGRSIHVHNSTNFDIHDKRAPTRQFYFPVMYAEPMIRMNDMIGVDLSSNPLIMELFEQGRDDGTAVPLTGLSSPYFTFAESENIKSDVILAQPVYQSSSQFMTIKQRRDALLGFLILQFNVGLALEAALSDTLPKGIDIYIVDVEADEGAEIVYHHYSRLSSEKQTLTYTQLWKDSDFTHISNLNISGRLWRMIMVPMSQYFANNRQYQSWMVLFFGLILSALISYVLITNLRRTEVIKQTVKIRTQDLEDSETNKRAVIENIAEGIVTINDSGIIEAFNPAAEKMFGYTANEALGNNISFLIPRNERDQHDGYVKHSKMYEPRIINKARELYGLHKDGKQFPIELNVSRMKLKGERKFIGIMHEISERRETANKLRRASDLVKVASRAKSDLIANMSHELRTPLNAIIGFSSTMKEQIFGPIENDKYQEYIEDINHSGLHLLELINDILDVSVIEASALELDEQKVNLARVVESSIRIIRPRAQSGHITISSSINDDIPMLYLDERRAKQIFLNLLSNAVKFSHQDSEVSLSAWLNDNGSLSIAVADTGIGMDEDEIAVALSTFGQVDSGLDRKYEGTGLGLPLTKGLIELHGGTLQVKSKKNRGTFITVTFPKERVI